MMKIYLVTLLVVYLVRSLVFSHSANSIKLGFGAGGMASQVMDPFNCKVIYTNKRSAIAHSKTAAHMRFGLVSGVSADYYSANLFSVRCEFNYEQKGAGDIFLSPLLPSGHPYGLNYLMVPVLGSMPFGPGKNWYVNPGDYHGYL